MTLAVEQPDMALRLVRAKLDFLLAEAKDRPEPPQFPVDGTEDDRTSWYISYGRAKEFRDLLETMEWNDLPTLAEASPDSFLRYLWSWYVDVFSEILARKDGEGFGYQYPGNSTSGLN